MESQPHKVRSWFSSLGIGLSIWLLASLLFGLAYTQSHLYNDNQNTKFLHGIAASGYGYLSEDWLANTADPLPVFSWVVQQTVTFLGAEAFYIYYLLLMGIYVLSLVGIGAHQFKLHRISAAPVLFFALLLSLHAVRVGILSKKILGLDLEPLHFGLAGQYILGLDFQNSSFGVFLLLSIFAFLRRKPALAILAICAACWFHAAYLFAAAWLTLAYLGILFFECLQSRPLDFQHLILAGRQPFTLGMLALVLVAPLVWYNQVVMSSTAPDLAERSLYILVHLRIPHHSLAAQWLTPTAYVQMALVALALILVRNSRLFPIMLIPLLGGLVFTLVQVATQNDALAILAPWRVSVFLVPLASSLILARLVDGLLSIPWIQWQRPWSQIVLVCAAAALVLFSVRGGLAIQQTRNRRYDKQANRLLMDYVKTNLSPGQLYLVPPQDNKFDEFRLYTGAPVLINWKSHPYRDFEVLEWYDRNLAAYAFYDLPASAACDRLSALSQAYRLSHYVSNREDPRPACPGWDLEYQDDQFELYALSGQP